MRVVFLIGRILFSLIFIVRGVEHFFPKVIQHGASMGVPGPFWIVPISGVISLVGGLSILFGYKAKVGAWLLVVFLLPTTFVMHRFWESGSGMENILHELCFLKNLALLGAALMVAYAGAGPLACDKQCCPHKHDHDKHP